MHRFNLCLSFKSLHFPASNNSSKNAKLRFTLLLIFLGLNTLMALRAQTAINSPTMKRCPVIPQPLHASISAAAHSFQLTPMTAITLKGTANKSMVDYFRGRLEVFLGKDWSKLGQRSGNAASEIILTCSEVAANKDTSLTNRNGYTLNVQPDIIHIQATTEQGLFFGLNSLLQLILQPENLSNGRKSKALAAVPCWNIQDQPALSWRGFMLDESRHFFGIRKVKEILDWMAFYKLNSFHWHLTDAPGWRMSINAFPELTRAGAVGNKTDSTAPAKFYTQAEIREVIQYAKERFIQVVPEIDMPGHATSANRAYPQMSGGGAGKYANFTFNPGKEEVYSFLTKILEETASLFPVHIIHLGGDEVAFGSASWKTDPDVQRLKQKEHLQDIKAVEFYFLRRMADSAFKYNQRILVWDEAIKAGLPKDKTTIMWWRHDKKKELGQALDEGYSVIFCPRLPLYFDFVQDSTHLVGRRWKKLYVGLKQVFDFWPAVVVPKGTKYNQDQIIGLQANLWSEQVQSEDRLEFLIFPRIAALATAGWTPPAMRSYPDFLSSLKTQLALYQKSGIYYFNYFDPSASPEPKK